MANLRLLDQPNTFLAEEERWEEWNAAAPGSARLVERDRTLRPGFLSSASMFLVRP